MKRNLLRSQTCRAQRIGDFSDLSGLTVLPDGQLVFTVFLGTPFTDSVLALFTLQKFLISETLLLRFTLSTPILALAVVR